MQYLFLIDFMGGTDEIYALKRGVIQKNTLGNTVLKQYSCQEINEIIKISIYFELLFPPPLVSALLFKLFICCESVVHFYIN